MNIERLKIHDFRNISDADLTFSPGVNLFYGNNAQGKTNVVEAIYYFARGKSFRSARDADLVRKGQDFFTLDLSYSGAERKETLSYAYGQKEKWRKKNGAKVDTAAEMIGRFRAVLFCPEHLLLVKGEPERRREFMNVAIGQIYPLYLRSYALYKKFLENRNMLLKNAQKGLIAPAGELEVWSEKTAYAAAEVYSYRARYIEKLSQYASYFLSEIAGKKETLSLFYDCDVKDGVGEKTAAEVYKEKMLSHLENEIAVGYSLYGVHRDDLGILLSGDDARVFASQGQQRSIVLALKMAEGEVSREVTGEYPVYLYDDVLSELDAERRKVILSGGDGRQTVITSCESDAFTKENVKKFYTEGGKYVSSYRERE